MARTRPSSNPLRTALAVAVATPAHLLTLAVAGLGVWLLWPGSTVFQKILGVLCLLLAYTLRPALGDVKYDGARVDLKQCPETARLVHEVAATLGCAGPTRVEIATSASADLRLIGLHGRVLSLGVPLWLALNSQERLALIGHQLGHLARGDVLLHRYVDGAVQTLRRWEGFMAPYRPGFEIDPQDQILMSSSGGDAVAQNAANGIIADVVSVLVWPIRVVVTAYRRLVLMLAAPSLARDARHADDAAARVAGTAATVALLEVLLALPAIETSANRAAARRADVAGAITERMAVFDADQRQALRGGDAAVALLGHPPTLERLRLVESAERRQPAVVVGREHWAAIDKELSGAVAQQIRRLADDYLYSH